MPKIGKNDARKDENDVIRIKTMLGNQKQCWETKNDVQKQKKTCWETKKDVGKLETMKKLYEGPKWTKIDVSRTNDDVRRTRNVKKRYQNSQIRLKTISEGQERSINDVQRTTNGRKNNVRRTKVG